MRERALLIGILILFIAFPLTVSADCRLKVKEFSIEQENQFELKALVNFGAVNCSGEYFYQENFQISCVVYNNEAEMLLRRAILVCGFLPNNDKRIPIRREFPIFVSKHLGVKEGDAIECSVFPINKKGKKISEGKEFKLRWRDMSSK